ncbi:MAG: sigma-54 dependent transcriptional regulator [Candidatus Cloacimonetes bacterium]|nr:sigma-54 dependent transcriptional regulator [Candidatus Cloacimonadota bacterium]
MSLLNILILDDEEGIRQELEDFFTISDYSVKTAAKPSEAFQILQKTEIDIAIVDIQLPEMNGLQVLERIKLNYPEIEVIMITGHGDMNVVIQALRAGAFDYFKKPFRIMEIKNSVEKTKKFIELNRKLAFAKQTSSYLSQELNAQIGTSLIGKSKQIRNVIDLINKVAKFDTTSVLITGESGTGKELVARSIHLLSDRKNTYFYPVNCSAVPENLFESEFFGHKKGSFTGATENKQGWFEIAHQGTLFLDEIGDMPLTQQIKFLRVLEDKKIRKIGSHQEINVDVRIVSATNKNLEELTGNSQFRIDLYHRLNMFSIHIPPLRERKEDIPILLEYFAKEFSVKMRKPIHNIEEDIYAVLNEYEFSGNVRELKNLVERAVILSEDGVLRLKYFPIDKKKSIEIPIAEISKISFDLEENEKSLINKALFKSDYNKTKAAELLNISWYALNRKMKKFGM